MATKQEVLNRIKEIENELRSEASGAFEKASSVPIGNFQKECKIDAKRLEHEADLVEDIRNIVKEIED